MHLRVSLDDGWINEYDETIATLIKQELTKCIKEEVKRVTGDVVRTRLDGLRSHLQQKMNELTPQKLDEYLQRISKEGI